MPARRDKQPPTLWQHAKPTIEASLGSVLAARGFGRPETAMTFWRRRRDFLDVVQLRSKYGSACRAYLGCHPLGVRESVPSEVQCIFRTSVPGEFEFPEDEVAIARFVRDELVPSVLCVVDAWFPRFASLERGLEMLESESREFDYYKKGSPVYQQALLETTECISRKAKLE